MYLNGPVAKASYGFVYKYKAATINQTCLSTQLLTNQSLLSSCAVVIIAMAKEEELKRVDLKVNVSCCEGCRRKVMKAMSLKGVLRTEIHPSLDRVTVVGNVDSKVLVKKLDKIGKIAEAVEASALPPEEQRKGEGNGRMDRDGGDKPAPAGEKSKRKEDGKDTGDKAAASKKDCNKCTHQHAARGGDAGHGKALSKDAAESVEEGDGLVGGARPSAPDHAVAAHHGYHRAEPPAMSVPVHMPYYAATAANVTPYYYGGYYAMPPPPPMPMPMPVARHRPQQLRPQPSRFDVDYFNEDNAVGCRVM